MKTRLLLLLTALVTMSLQTFAGGFTIYLDTPSGTFTSSDYPEIKSGTVTWDATTRILTLDNVTIEFTGMGNDFDLRGDRDTTIKLIGNNSIVSADYVAFYDHISDSKTLTITSDDGQGTLTCEGWSGI